MERIRYEIVVDIIEDDRRLRPLHDNLGQVGARLR